MQSILGYLIALTLGLMGLAGMTVAQLQQRGQSTAAATAQQAQQILAAAQSYIAAAPAGLPSTSASAPATITVPQLVGPPGNLFPGYAASSCNSTAGCPNPYGQTWQVQVICTAQACPQTAQNPNSGPWISFLMSAGGSSIPLMLAPQIADQVGANGGNTPMNDDPAGTPTTKSIEGAYAGWSYPLTGLTNPGPGHLVCRVN